MLAVTAAALQGLVDLGATPFVVDDVVDRVALFADHDDYLRWQLGWLRRLDEAVGAQGALLASAQKIKVVVDSMVITGRLVAATLAALAPPSIELVAAPPAVAADPLRDGHLQFWPRLGDRPLWDRLLPAAASATGISLRVHEVSLPRLDAAGPSHSPSLADRWLARAADATGPLRHFDLAHWRPGTRAGTIVMTWPGGYGGRALVGAARRSGERVLLLERRDGTVRLVEPVPWGRRAIGAPIPVERGAAAPSAEGADAAGAAGSVRAAIDAALAEVDGWARVPGAAAILAPRLAAFVERIVPAVTAAVAPLADELERVGATRVVTANPATIGEFAVLVAAGRLGVERVLAQHGDHLFPYDAWLVTETPAIDLQLASDPTLVEDLPEAATRLGTRAPAIEVSGHRWKPASRHQDPTGSICYVPSVLLADSTVLPSMYFDDAWYHRWHLRLLRWMADRPNRTFVWKALPSGDHVEDPIAEAVRATPNVDYVTRPLPWVLGRVSRVVTDFPSTPVYEAAWAGRPLLVLWFPRFSALRPRAVRAFDPVVRRCDDEDGALAELSAWSEDDPRRWVVPLDRLQPLRRPAR